MLVTYHRDCEVRAAAKKEANFAGALEAANSLLAQGKANWYKERMFSPKKIGADVTPTITYPHHQG